MQLLLVDSMLLLLCCLVLLLHHGDFSIGVPPESAVTGEAATALLGPSGIGLDLVQCFQSAEQLLPLPPAAVVAVAAAVLVERVLAMAPTMVPVAAAVIAVAAVATAVVTAVVTAVATAVVAAAAVAIEAVAGKGMAQATCRRMAARTPNGFRWVASTDMSSAATHKGANRKRGCFQQRARTPVPS